jgi:hypothetical protein
VKTRRRASKALGVLTTKQGMAGGWTWSLPPKVVKSGEGAQDSDVATFEEIGHLREPDDAKADVEL